MKIEKIKDVHLAGVFGDFRETVQRRMETLRATKNEENLDTARFFEFLLSEVDADQYTRIQRRYTGQPDGMTKYLDPINWFESKLRVARKLGLNNRPPLRILDLGTGPGHFPVVARFYGHDVTGTDLPKVSGGPDKTGHFYDALCDVYRVKRISHVIRPNIPLENLEGRYNMVTAFLAAFNVYENKKPWTIAYWQYFLGNLRRDVLEPEGQLFMMLADDKLTPDVWTYLTSLGDWSVERSKQLFISNFAPFTD